MTPIDQIKETLFKFMDCKNPKAKINDLILDFVNEAAKLLNHAPTNLSHTKVSSPAKKG